MSVDCNFEEEHICGYQSDDSANFNWVRNNGPGSTLNTGPIVDVNNIYKREQLLFLTGSKLFFARTRGQISLGVEF